METKEEFKLRRKSELLHEIKGIEEFIANSQPPKTSEWGSGAWKKRKNKQYAGHHNRWVNEMKDRLVSAQKKLDDINN